MPLNKINWLALESELRAILRDSNFDPQDALRCIDESIARHTGRGNELPDPGELEYTRLSNQFPLYFDWTNH